MTRIPHSLMGRDSFNTWPPQFIEQCNRSVIWMFWGVRWTSMMKFVNAGLLHYWFSLSVAFPFCILQVTTNLQLCFTNMWTCTSNSDMLKFATSAAVLAASEQLLTNCKKATVVHNKHIMGVVRGVVYRLGRGMWVWLCGPWSHFRKVEAYVSPSSERHRSMQQLIISFPLCAPEWGTACTIHPPNLTGPPTCNPLCSSVTMSAWSGCETIDLTKARLAVANLPWWNPNAVYGQEWTCMRSRHAPGQDWEHPYPTHSIYETSWYSALQVGCCWHW